MGPAPIRPPGVPPPAPPTRSRPRPGSTGHGTGGLGHSALKPAGSQPFLPLPLGPSSSIGVPSQRLMCVRCVRNGGGMPGQAPPGRPRATQLVKQAAFFGDCGPETLFKRLRPGSVGGGGWGFIPEASWQPALPFPPFLLRGGWGLGHGVGSQGLLPSQLIFLS